jgi:hypothetical protein
MVLGEVIPQIPNTGSTVPSPQNSVPTPLASAHRITPPNSTAAESRQVSDAPPPQFSQETTTFRQTRQVSGAGPDTLPELPADRQRKTSLTARLGKAFGNPALQNRPSEHYSDSSPTSASGSSRIKSSFSKAFRRTSGGTSPQHSPRPDSHNGPPVPPKDEYSSRSTIQNGESSVAGAYRTPSGGMGYAPPIVYVAPKDSESFTAGSFPEAVSGLYPARNEGNHLSPSPSAKRIMLEARIKSMTQEEEIQNRFRRDLHVDEKGPGAQEEVNDLDDDDVRLPYDTSDHSVSDHLKLDGVDENPEDHKATPSMQIPRKSVDYALNDVNSCAPHGAVPADLIEDSNGTIPAEAGLHHRTTGSGLSSADNTLDASTVASESVDATDAGDATEAVPSKLEEHLSARLRDDQRHFREEERDTAGREADLAQVQRQQQAEELARQVAVQRLHEMKEQERLETEAHHRAQAAAELQRHAEEYARQKEAERLQEQAEQERRDADARRKKEEQERQEAEDRRVQEELRRKRKDEEEETLRLALEEQHRMDQIRVAEEEARRKEEERRRIEAERQEAERVRKEGIKQTLRDGKQRGGVMLRGVSPQLQGHDKR